MTFNPSAFAATEQRRIARLTRAARAVGMTHVWFRRAAPEEQAAKIAEWTEAALYARAVRLGQEPDVWPRPGGAS